jgi:hypothetical protein
MVEFLEAIENSGFATYIRETARWPAYSTVLALHTFGMAFLVGLSGVIALRVTGVVPELPLNPLRKLQPVIVVGFWVNAITGVILASLAVQSLLKNWDFYVKLVAIAFALLALAKMRRYAFADPNAPDDAIVSPEGRRWAKAMLFFWGLAVLGGRLTAYATNIRIQSALAVVIGVVLLLFLARYLVQRAHRAVPARHPVSASQSVTAR